MVNASAIAITAQNVSSNPMRRNGSPNWLNGVKNSQNTKERKRGAHLLTALLHHALTIKSSKHYFSLGA